MERDIQLELEEENIFEYRNYKRYWSLYKGKVVPKGMQFRNLLQ